jgi:two-component system, cell cycle response regulator DivK
MNAARQTSQRARPPSVLIADDVSDTREMYVLYFSNHGYKVYTATDGHCAMAVAAERRPDVIVMDLSMPGIDGISATRRLRRDARLRHIPIIILTAYPMRAAQDGVLESGADAFLTKPCLPEELEQHVRQLLDSKPPRDRS